MDMNNKLCVITGANSGIGFETTKELARQGAFIVMVCRNEDKAIAAKKEIEQDISASGIEIVLCDFASQDEIKRAANEIKERYETIDVLINNHGFIAAEYRETVDGLEETFAVNHIGYFLFTNELLERVVAADNGRIVNVASEAHRNGSFDPDDVQLKKNFSAMKAYSNSKLFNILFTKELADRLSETDVTVNCLHPGVVNSNFGSNSTFLVRMFWKVAGLFMKSNEEGAATTIYLASSDEVEGVNGAYFSDCKAIAPRKQATDMEAAAQLWEMSEKMCGINP
jgi:NAD(P)-dependent dehydrogenase (short-subunit alcohol dehydrogenase family)